MRTDGKEHPSLKGSVRESDARCAAFLRLLPLIPPAPFSHTGRRGSLSVLMPETEDGTQGLPRAQGGLQPARAPARQPRRGFPALREGFSPPFHALREGFTAPMHRMSI
jgi:hypothetical protein